MRKCKALILAAGKGKRMKSDIPKVLHKAGSLTMIEMVYNALNIDLVDEIGIVVSPDNHEQIKAVMGTKIQYIVQKEQLGTGHAVICAEEWLNDYDGDLIVVVGDAPFIDNELISDLVIKHNHTKSSCTFLTSIFDTPPAYGRIIRDEDGRVKEIVEEKDATEEQKKIKEVSSSHYCFDYKLLKKCLKNVNNNNAQKEYYLPDVIAMMINDNKIVETVTIDDPYKTYGVNSQEDLEFAMKRFGAKDK